MSLRWEGEVFDSLCTHAESVFLHFAYLNMATFQSLFIEDTDVQIPVHYYVCGLAKRER